TMTFYFGVVAILAIIAMGLSIAAAGVYYMKRHRVNLLSGVTFGVLALGDGTELSSNPTLARTNSITGDFVFYLVMGLVMEFITGVAFLLSSTLLMQRRRRY
ncbi:hypothetical protein MPER_10484, partial [Moniliophthora perniciosa FA553]